MPSESQRKNPYPSPAYFCYTVLIPKHTIPLTATARYTLLFGDWLLSKKAVLPLLLYVLCVLTPLYLILSKTESSVLTIVGYSLSQHALFGCFLTMHALLKTQKLRKFSVYVAVPLNAIFYTCVYFLLMFWMLTGYSFDIYFTIDSFAEIMPTVKGVLGLQKTLVLSGFLLCIWLLILLLMQRSTVALWHHSPRSPRTHLRLLLATALCAVVLTPFAYDDLYIDMFEKAYARKHDQTHFPDNSHYSTTSTDTIFILQLESINALLADKQVQVDGTAYDDEYLPHLRSVAKHGVYFPYFWSHEVVTNKAFASIFCGIVANLKSSFAYRTDELETTCLPDILQRNGYHTVAYRSDTLEFGNMGKFLSTLGFTEVHSSDIMQPGDLEYEWGYDDCTFYRRLFEDLANKKTQDQPLFVYTEVSAHHYPYEPKDEYREIVPFPDTNVFVEKYINSLTVQDRCVKTFFDLYEQFADDSSHLFIFADTSWGIGHDGQNTSNITNILNDNFLTVLTYIPPRQQRAAVAGTVSAAVYAQTDLLPTIFSLLNGTNYQNSFASALTNQPAETDPTYEQCHVFTQPWGLPRVAVVSGSQKYVYNVSTETVDHFDLAADPLETQPVHQEALVDWHTFTNTYYCERYREQPDLASL